MNRRTPILVSIITLTVAFAGCTSSDEAGAGAGDSGESSSTINLGNKGAINGLIVDDNYRPVQLKEEWGTAGPGDYQDIGFVLVMETAQRFETNENGEFQVIPLDPGTYTLRVAADNHEAIDKKVSVVAGEFSEVTVEARRAFSGGGTILSQEQTLFVSCYGSAFLFKIALASAAAGCGDLSGDSSRFDFETTYPDIKDDVRGLVVEMFAHQEWRYTMTVRIVNGYAGAPGDLCDYGAGYCYYGDAATDGDGQYLKLILYPELQYDDEAGTYLEDGQPGYCKVGRDSACETYAFTTEHGFQTALFTGHPTDDTIAPACDPTEPVRDEVTNAGLWGGCNGVGLTLGTKAQFIQNVFLYELPDEGIEDYCVLCEDAAIPE